MRAWLQWAAIAAVAGAAIAVFGYLINCGPGLTGQRSVAARPDLSAGGAELPPPSPRRELGAIRIGWTAWADAEVVTLMAQKLLERRLGYRVDRVMTDIGIQYQAVANGDLDVMLMAWLPVTHSNYWEKVRTEVVNLGPLYMGRLGWAVPAYVPEGQLSSIGDLKDPAIGRRIKRRIQGIDPGSGLMQASERAMQAYGLDRLQLVAASGAAMTAVLDRAIRRKEWVVVTAWKPHWIFAQYQLRFLEDPKGVLGGDERIHVIARRGFQETYPPEVTEFLSRMYLPGDELSSILLATQDQSVDAAVDQYIRAHPRRINYWLTGTIDEPE